MTTELASEIAIGLYLDLPMVVLEGLFVHEYITFLLRYFKCYCFYGTSHNVGATFVLLKNTNSGDHCVSYEKYLPYGVAWA